MPGRTDIKKILIIGAGAVNVGNSGELDYFCRNASITLRNMGYKTVIVNPNPAAASNEEGIADSVYIEALNADRLTEIIKKETPDAIIPIFGAGQSMTLCHELSRKGILDEYSVKLLGTPFYAIECSESMIKFKNIMENLGISTFRFKTAGTIDEANDAAEEIGYPVMIHPEFALSQNEDDLCYNSEELNSVAADAIEASTTGNVLISKAYPDYYNYVLEVMRDSKNNSIIVSTIENISPLCVHPGDAVSVAPIMTLSEEELTTLKDDAKRIAEAMQIVGFIDIRFAKDPKNGKFYVVSVSPTISAMTSVSALVSGIPAAEVLARIAAGEDLWNIEFENKPLGEYRFEYDEVFVKLPRWPFDVYKTARNRLGVRMRAAGYVAGAARDFKEALQKAVRSLGNGYYGLGNKNYASKTKEQLMIELVYPKSDTISVIYEALRKDADIAEIASVTGIKPYFIEEIKKIIDTEKKLLRFKNKMPIEPVLINAKKHGFSDRYIADVLGINERDIRAERQDAGIEKGWEAIGENQRFSTYAHSLKREISDEKKIIVLGGGANRIGRGMEFDYCLVRSAEAIKKAGYEAIVINPNPTASSVYKGIFDKVYFEPLTAEDILDVIKVEKPWGVIAGFGGINSYELICELENEGVNIIGYGSDVIKKAADKRFFEQAMAEMDISIPRSQVSSDMEEALATASGIGYPVMVKQISKRDAKFYTFYSSGEFLDYIENIAISEKNPVLIESFLEHSTEFGADILADGENIFIPGIIEHIESAGINSGDSACIIPSKNISEENAKKIYEACKKIVSMIGIRGIVHINFAIDPEKVYLLGVIPGASRTIPVEEKIFGTDMIEKACGIFLKGEKVPAMSGVKPDICGVLEVVFPWKVFPECDPLLGREMYSTGVVLGIGKTEGEAFLKAQEATGTPMPEKGNVFISVNDHDKSELANVSRSFKNAGFDIIATSGTAKVIKEAGIEVESVKKVYEGRPNVLDLMINKKVQIVINTPTDTESYADDSYIRKACVKQSIAYMTTMAAAKAAAKGLEDAAKK